MTKKHLEALAAIIRKERIGDGSSWDACANRIMHNIAAYCAEQNENFDENRFYRACGMEV